MAEVPSIRNKCCGRCGVSRGASDFFRDRHKASGLSSWCRDCHRIARQSPARKLSEWKYARSDKGRARWQRAQARGATTAAIRRYRQTENGRLHARVAASRYGRTQKGRENSRRQRLRWPDKVRARLQVANALRHGKLQKLPCADCGNSRVHAHHDDYAKPLDVTWLCSRCHSKRHPKSA